MINVCIIPARLASTRLANKVLLDIKGFSMIQLCYYRAKLLSNIDEVFVATCDKEIGDHVKSFGGVVVYTSNKHKRAFTRTIEALTKIKKKHKKIKNCLMIQGDEPTFDVVSANNLVKIIFQKKAEIANLVMQTKNKKVIESKDNIKVIEDKSNNAIYMSRSIIPFDKLIKKSYLIQTGVICFNYKFILKVKNLNETKLEKIESIDMNRLIENRILIKLLKSNKLSIGIDTKKDLKFLLKNINKDKYFNTIKKKYA